jgi:hypothetical protein
MLLIGSGWTLLAAFDIWLILFRPDAPWDKKISFLLGMIGIYTFAFGVVSGSGVLDWNPRLGRDLTGPHPTLLLAGIASVLSDYLKRPRLPIDWRAHEPEAAEPVRPKSRVPAEASQARSSSGDGVVVGSSSAHTAAQLTSPADPLDLFPAS